MSTTNASSTGGSPSTSSNRRPSVFSSHKDMSLDDLTRSISISSSAAVNGFRGGSPNLEHPHWLQMSSTNGSSGPEAQASSSRAEASSSAPLPSPGLAEDCKGKGKGSASSPAAQPAAGSSSSPFSSPGPSGLPAHVTAPSKKHRSPSHGSIVRPGAPTSINLSDLTSGKASFGGQSRAHRPRKSQSSILVAASEGEQGAGSTSKGAARNKPPSYEHATGLPNGHDSSSSGVVGLGDVTRTDTRSAVPTPETSPQPSRRTSTTSPSGHARQNGSSSASQGKANSRPQHHSPALSSSSPTPQVHQGKIRPDHTTSSSSSSSSSFPSLAALTGNAGGSALRNFRMRFGRSSGSKRVNDADEDGASGSGSAHTHAGDGDKKDEKERKGTM
ncbi:hypothetical protein BDZ90DRAFT_6971 [Jaminaea rosea]|uniref:Uncharacterized protein n=1 Tax=Jaminaea rosea TaxID=1569628 RepID=A0A316V1Z6_9BASI|nr:hypothetical protein BDZ90DRAFT_6971 [Jaminaea rosea]PWN30203.1 hypothetical protein BDZ90DRAFT_6971 [Jaminaea rosea]